jgi:UDP-N-acetylglucosamine transferase subunit ALG13
VIFVTVGTAGKGIDFTRLIVEMDRIAPALGREVLIQRGPAEYEPVHARHVRYVPFDEAVGLFRQAELIVGHAGAGTVLMALRFQRPMVIVPRRIAAHELDTDDHQMQLAEPLSHMRGVRVVLEVGGLEAAIRDLLASGEQPEPSQERRSLVAAVKEFVGTGRRA